MNCCELKENIEISKQVFKNGITHHRKTCKTCKKFLGYAPQPLNPETTKIYFGKHKGQFVKDLPIDYLNWLLNEPWVKANLKELIVSLL